MKKCKKCVWSLLCKKKVKIFCKKHQTTKIETDNKLENFNLNGGNDDDY